MWNNILYKFAALKLTSESSSAGRARPCQGRGRGFESRLSLKRERRFLITNKVAGSPEGIPVEESRLSLKRKDLSSAGDIFLTSCPGGGIGRHVGLKIQWALRPCGFKSRPGYIKPLLAL